MKKIIMIVISVITLSSCEKEIELDLNSSNPKYVVEGEIPQNELATVKITKTVIERDHCGWPIWQGAG